MKSEFPSEQEYSAQTARYPALAVVDIRAAQAAVTESYRNEVLLDVNNDCMRLAVFDGEYRWHRHPDSDELFLVVAGTLQVDLEDGRCLELGEWQSVVIPAGTMHRTRAIGRTVNLTCEKIRARTVFVDNVLHSCKRVLVLLRPPATAMMQRGAKCPEQHRAAAASCAFKSRANRAAWAFATAWPASEGPAASSQRLPASPHRSRCPAKPPNTCARATAEPGTDSGSARFAARPSSTPKKAGMIVQVLPLAHSPMSAFRRRRFRSTTAAGIRGCSCLRARSHSRRIRIDRARILADYSSAAPRE